MVGNWTKHAVIRAQQRGIPPLITEWLLDFGEEVFDGRGGIIRYFSRRSIRKIERVTGAAVVSRLSEYLRCYLVEDTGSGKVITVGKRRPNKHLRGH